MPVDILSSLPLDLIITNREPSETELGSARQMLPYFQHEISDISAQIVEMEERLRELQSARRTLQRKEARLKCVVAPIRRVPEGVICLIFDYCLRECCALEDDLGDFLPLSVDDRHASEHSLSFMSTRKMPLHLTHVSRGFRRLALAMPMLWSVVEFNIRSPTLSTCYHYDSTDYNDVCISRSNRISGMKEWLRRSGSLPLNLEVHFSFSPNNHNNYDELQKLYDGMIDIMISCHTRWRDIRFSFYHEPPEKLMSALSALNSEDLPLLRTLMFHSYGYKGSTQYFKFMPIFSCPSLKTLTGVLLDGLHIYKDILCSSFSNLTLLHAYIGTYNLTIATMLRQCTSLIELRLFHTGERDDISVLGYEIELPCLQKLYVMDDASTIGQEVQYSMKTIKYMITPKLDTFYYQAQWSHITFIPYIFTHSHNLTTLGISGQLSCGLFLEILRYCPEIKRLDSLPAFTDNGPDLLLAYDKFLRQLVDANNAGDIICPRLEDMNGGYHPIPIINVNTLNSIVTRKGTDPSANLAPWRILRAKITCRRKDETTMRKLLRKCNRNIFVLKFCGVYDHYDT